MEGNPNDFGEDEAKLCVPSGSKIGEIFPELNHMNIGENPLSDWIEIGDVFGLCPLEKLKISYSEIETILYRKEMFNELSRV